MPTFIDESGDTGLGRDSLAYFRLAAVWVPASEVGPLRQDIRSLRKELGVADGFEFKYFRSARHPERRARFLAAAAVRGFRFAVCSVDKTSGRWRAATKSDIHYATAAYLAGTMRPLYRLAELAAGRRLGEPVTVDNNADEGFLDIVSAAFRGLESGMATGVPIVGRPRFGDSARDELLQLADMTCGAVGDHLDGRSDWYDIIRNAGLGINCGRGLGVCEWS